MIGGAERGKDAQGTTKILLNTDFTSDLAHFFHSIVGGQPNVGGAQTLPKRYKVTPMGSGDPAACPAQALVDDRTPGRPNDGQQTTPVTVTARSPGHGLTGHWPHRWTDRGAIPAPPETGRCAGGVINLGAAGRVGTAPSAGRQSDGLPPPLIEAQPSRRYESNSVPEPGRIHHISAPRSAERAATYSQPIGEPSRAGAADKMTPPNPAQPGHSIRP